MIYKWANRELPDSEICIAVSMPNIYYGKEYYESI